MNKKLLLLLTLVIHANLMFTADDSTQKPGWALMYDPRDYFQPLNTHQQKALSGQSQAQEEARKAEKMLNVYMEAMRGNQGIVKALEASQGNVPSETIERYKNEIKEYRQKIKELTEQLDSINRKVDRANNRAKQTFAKNPNGKKKS